MIVSLSLFILKIKIMKITTNILTSLVSKRSTLELKLERLINSKTNDVKKNTKKIIKTIEALTHVNASIDYWTLLTENIAPTTQNNENNK